MDSKRRYVIKALMASFVGGLLAPAMAWSELSERTCSGLFADFELDLRARGVLLPEEETSWLVEDLSTGERLVAINTDVPRQCASLVKLFVAVAFLHEVENGRFRYGLKSRKNMEWMLRRSDNPATNWFFQVMGGPEEVQSILDEHYGGIARTVSIVESIPPDGRTYRNKASAEDYNSFFRALWRGELPMAGEIRRNMEGWRRPGGKAGPVKGFLKIGYTAKLCGMADLYLLEAGNGMVVPLNFVGLVERAERDESARWRAVRDNVLPEAAGLACAGPFAACQPGHGRDASS